MTTTPAACRYCHRRVLYHAPYGGPPAWWTFDRDGNVWRRYCRAAGEAGAHELHDADPHTSEGPPLP